MGAMATTIGLVMLACLTTTVDSYRILLIPMPVGSNIVRMSSAAEALATAGHDAHVLKPRSVPIPSQYQHSGIHYINYGEKDRVHFTQTEQFTKTVGGFSQASFLDIVRFANTLLSDLCNDILLDEELYNELEKMKFDFAVVHDLPLVTCLHAVPHRLNIPHGTMTVAPPLDMVGTTLQSVYITPCLPFFYSKQPRFLIRFIQFLVIQGINLSKLFKEDYELINHYIRDQPVNDIRELRVKAKIWLVDEPLIDEPKHYPPNMIMVGGISAAPSNPLPKDLQTFADSAKDGLVVVSFGGSYTTDFPEEILRKLLSGLSLIKYHVIIRLKTKPSYDIGKNILITKWLPQNDLLGHNNTVLFVTHCGMSSINEAVYHGIPMLGFPNHFEQRANAIRFSDKNYGLMMDRDDFTPEELKTNIERMLTDTTWRDAVKNGSRIIKSRRFTAREEAVYWIEHVIQHGADHLTPSTNKLSWYQIMMYDIVATILILLLIIVFVLVKCCQCCKHVCCGKSTKQKRS